MLKKWVVVGVTLLLVATGVVAALHLGNQENIPCMVILQGDRKLSVSFADLNQTVFSGELTDGKGDTAFHKYTGILLRELLKTKGVELARISGVTVTSADNYSVEFTAEEILQADKVYVAISADGAKIAGIDSGTEGVQIIVFGDSNSRRCVRFAQRITIK